VFIEARVRFDPSRDDVKLLEVVHNGKAVPGVTCESKAREIRCRFRHRIDEASWLAARASGQKLGEKPHPVYKQISPSLAHSSPIFVNLKNAPPLAARGQAKETAQKWADMLDSLEKRLAEGRFQSLVHGSEDGVTLEFLKKNRVELLERVRQAKQRFLDRAH
jgi:hypothetical protein